jgi:hypothetical protein
MSMLNGSVEEDSVGTLDLRLFIISIYSGSKYYWVPWWQRDQLGWIQKSQGPHGFSFAPI